MDNAGFRTIDTKMHGRAGITGVFIVEGEQRALVETGPKSSFDHLLSGLKRAGVDELDWILVTHIHLDHAGAAGTLADRFPGAKVGVHEVGAPHLVDPTKLWSSAERIYRDQMESLWGGIDPVPQDRVHVLKDGDEIDLGGRTLRAVETPGHAGHHHAFLDDATGTVFTGDALGVRLQDIGVMRPATPPPEFDLEVAKASIRKIADLGAERLCLTHYGTSDEGEGPTGVRETCDRAIEALDRWGEWVRDARTRSKELDEVAAAIGQRSREALRDRLDDDALERMEQTTSDWMNTWGYMRYYDKQER